MKTHALAAAIAVVLIAGVSAPAFADGHQAKINAYIESNIRG